MEDSVDTLLSELFRYLVQLKLLLVAINPADSHCFIRSTKVAAFRAGTCL